MARPSYPQVPLPHRDRTEPPPARERSDPLELYSVTGPERDGLIQLTREARQRGWWHSFRDVLPNPYEVYIGLEVGAASIRNSSPWSCPACADGGLRAGDLVRRLDPDRVMAERTVESAHRALIGVGAQDLFGEPAAPRARAASLGCSAASGKVESRYVEVDRRTDKFGQDRREMAIQQQPNGCGQRPRIG